MKRVFWLGGCLLLSLSLQVIAQSIGGSLHGRVLDAQGNGVTNAALTLRDQERGRERSLLTDGQGDYTLSGIEPGTYRLAIQAPGFANFLGPLVHVRVGDSVRVDARLQVTQVSDVVEVIDSATVLQTADPKTARSFSAEEMNDLPTAAGSQGRNFYTQARTAPGVALSTRAHQPFSISGQRAINNNYLIDSVDNNDPNTGLIAGRGANEQLISQEAIASFEVLTHNFKAEYGRNSGGIVSIVSKSGTNEWHGSVYE